MRKQAARFGAEFLAGHVVKVDLSQKNGEPGKKPIEVNLGRETLLTRTLIIASGASARWLGLPNEQALIGHGVSSCATCDGFFFSGKEIAVIGGGDSAMEEALFLTRFATKVTLIHRRGEFRASKIMLDRARKHEQIQFLTDTVVDDVYDANKKEVTGLRLRNVKTGEQWDFPTSAMFLGIGHTPNAQFVGDQLDARWRGLSDTRRLCLLACAGCLRQRRRGRPALSPGGYRRRHRMHGRAGSGEVSGRDWEVSWSLVLSSGAASSASEVEDRSPRRHGVLFPQSFSVRSVPL